MSVQEVQDELFDQGRYRTFGPTDDLVFPVKKKRTKQPSQFWAVTPLASLLSVIVVLVIVLLLVGNFIAHLPK